MNAWLASLSHRDRRTLQVGAVVIGVALLWAFGWYPLAQSRARLAAQVATAEANLAWMRGAAAQVKGLRANGGDVFDRAGKSLLALADASAREAGLGAALTRAEPVDGARVNVWFERANFDQLAGWLELMASRYGVGVEELSIERGEGVGLVDARVALIDSPR